MGNKNYPIYGRGAQDLGLPTIPIFMSVCIVFRLLEDLDLVDFPGSVAQGARPARALWTAVLSFATFF